MTPSFLPACSELALGELLHDDMFGLFEAMSAIEMMDPKMDAGMVCNRSARSTACFTPPHPRSSNTPLSWEEAVSSGKVVLGNPGLSPKDLVGGLAFTKAS